MSVISEVIPMEAHCLEVRLENGCSIILNLTSRLETVRFGLLTDEVFFCSVTTDGKYIRWADKIEISVNELFQLAQK